MKVNSLNLGNKKAVKSGESLWLFIPTSHRACPMKRGMSVYTYENEKGKANKLDEGNKKDQPNNYKTKTWVGYKVKGPRNIAGNQNRNKQKV